MTGFETYLSELLSHALSGLFYFVPELLLIVTFILVILADLIVPGRKSIVTFWTALTGVATSGLLSYMQLSQLRSGITMFSGNVVLDDVAIRFKLIFVFVVIVFLVFIRSNKMLQEHRKGTGDLYMLIPAILLGLNLMAMSTSLLMIFISIEMVSIGSYLMVGYMSEKSEQSEAAVKYALFGSVCSAIMLYGMSLLYAYTGTINIISGSFVARLAELPSFSTSLALILTLVGIGFKLSFVPLHFWTPDVYQGAPTPVTAFLSTAPKIAGFALLIRFLAPFYVQAASGTPVFDFELIISVIAILTMIAGNFAAIWQSNVKRMLAYSSIGHTGFALMAVVTFSTLGFKSLLFYFSVYAVMNMAAFMLADRIEEQSGASSSDDYKGLGSVLKLEMVCFVIVLIALTGLPPTGGFTAKLFVFSSVFEIYSATGSKLILLMLIVGALTTVVSLFYYLKIPLNAYLRKRENDTSVTVGRGFITYAALLLTGILLALGIFPDILG